MVKVFTDSVLASFVWISMILFLVYTVAGWEPAWVGGHRILLTAPWLPTAAP